MLHLRISLDRKVILPVILLLLTIGCAGAIVRLQPPAQTAPATPLKDMAGVGAAGPRNGAEEADLYAANPQQVSGESAQLSGIEDYWYTRVSYPTGKYDGRWLLQAAQQDRNVQGRVPAGRVVYSKGDSPLTLDPNSWTPLGPQPLQSDGCLNCFAYGHVSGRVNDIKVDPVDHTIAYIVPVGGGVWKTTNCCTASTTWTAMTDDPLVSTVQVDDVSIDPSNHNTVYVGTGDLNYGSFAMGSAGILKSTDAGSTWAVKGANVFTGYFPEPAGNFPQYQAVGKVEADPRNSNTVVAGAKTGVYFSYDGGDNWTGPCLPDAFPNQRQDITGLILHDNGSLTDMYVAVGTRGYSTTVQYNLAENGANGIYKSTVPSSGCPASWTLSSRSDNGWPASTGSGTPYHLGGDTLGRIDLAIAPSDPNYIYAIVQSIASPGAVLGVWRTTDGGTTWSQRSTVSGFPTTCSNAPGSQNWYNQHIAVDPNDPQVVLADTIDIFKSTNGGTNFTNITCGYSGGRVHVDQHAIEYVPGSSSMLLTGSDGGVYLSLDANQPQPTFTQLNDSLNTIEFYSGDITSNFATSSSPGINAGAQDNGSSVYVWPNNNVGPAMWQLRKGGDGMYARIEPVLGQRWYQESQNGNLAVSLTGAYGSQQSATGGWTGDSPRVSFVFPYEIYKYDCPPTGCMHMIAGSYRVWETILGGVPASSWMINSPDLTKATLADRSFINQLSYSVSLSTTAIVGTNDGNVQYGFNLGQGVPSSATWVNVTGSNAVLPNRPILDVTTDPLVPTIGYAAVGGFDQNTPSTPGHVYQVTCAANCSTFTWANKSGNLPNIPVDSILANPLFPQQVFAGSDWGLYYTNDITQVSPTWFRFNTGMPNSMIWDLSIDRGYTTLAAFTRGRGAYAWPLPSGPFGGGTPTPGGPSPTRTSTAPAASPTQTATTPPVSTPSATPTVCGVQMVSGTIDNSDPSHDNYVDLSDPSPSDCSVSRTCPGVFTATGPWHYDTYTFANTDPSPQCVTVTIDATGCASAGVWALAYLNSYDPNSLCNNYLGDAGSDPVSGVTSFSFIVPGSSSFVLEVEEYTHLTGCASYTATVAGLGSCSITATPTLPVNTPTRTNTPTHTPIPVVGTNTPTRTNTSTHTPGPGGGTNTPTPTLTSTACPIQFTDVPNPSTFYAYIRCLACRGIVNGYSDGTFRPNNNVTRGQLSKIVSNSAGFNDPQTVQMFEDVPVGSTFFDYIGRLASRGYISGYPCGGTGEPCNPPNNLPYFRTNNNATRGQITKIVSNAAGFIDPPAGQIFEDSPPGSTFYTYTNRLASRGVMQGYPCGGVGEPCNPPNNRPYFRPFNNATRGQTSKIVANTFFPDCETPSRK